MREFERGKKAAIDGDLEMARELLRPIADFNPHHPAVFFLCLIESTKGSIQNCDEYCPNFLSRHPKHLGMRTISALLHIAKGNFSEAESDLNITLASNPQHTRASRTLKKLKILQQEELARGAIEVLDSTQSHSVISSFSRLKAAKRLKKISPVDDWDNHQSQAKVAFFYYSKDVRRAFKNYDSELIDSAVELGYCTWPRKIQSYIHGRNVLDVGCGYGGYAIGFLCAGVRTYTGIDPAMPLNTKDMRNKRIREWVAAPKSGHEIMAAIPDIQLHQCSTRELIGTRKFDVICLHNVTEHLLDIEQVFEDISKLLSVDGQVIFLHHNFYGWSGHHMPPHSLSVLDENNPEHLEYCDWRHISIVEDVPRDHCFHTDLNLIRMNDLHKLTQKFFKIEAWENRLSPKGVLDRLTPEIEKRVRKNFPDVSMDEMKTNLVFCVAGSK
ncbi:methyltransferase domain-containing protein [Flexibacterium corallicola]|uniref:methyltransferase domain-containing protein n=1 Tax=Flexibacterium corallicola TaxID=3037259 RepID=UPI00286EC4A2|nr:methyltransferase domain-containing protein [Pseudovibrio sp. M1P-2-3]